MRFIAANYLKPGQVVGRDLTFDRGRVLLRSGIALTQTTIQKVRSMGFQGIYVDDEISAGIRFTPLVSPRVHSAAEKEIYNLFAHIRADSTRSISGMLMAMNTTITALVDELIRANGEHRVVNMVDIRGFDEYLHRHTLNVTILSTFIAAAMALPRKSLLELAMGCVVHDIGKVFIDPSIIQKRARLTTQEYEIVRQHSQTGYNFVYREGALPQSAKDVVLTHHEQYNGYGYPQGLSQRDIPLFGRIVAVADVYDALLCDRPYRSALTPSAALENLLEGNATLFDPDVLDVFIRKVPPYPAGSVVTLTGEEPAIVVETTENTSLRPMVRLLRDGTYINLAYDYNALNINIEGVTQE